MSDERRVVVLGAGLAGAACAYALACEGWRVQVVHRGALDDRDGSAQPWVADHLHLSPDDNPTARLTRQALELAQTPRWQLGVDSQAPIQTPIQTHIADIVCPIIIN